MKETKPFFRWMVEESKNENIFTCLVKDLRGDGAILETLDTLNRDEEEWRTYLYLRGSCMNAFWVLSEAFIKYKKYLLEHEKRRCLERVEEIENELEEA